MTNRMSVPIILSIALTACAGASPTPETAGPEAAKTKLTVIEFLGPDCPSCERMSADLDRLARNESFDHVTFLGIVSYETEGVCQAMRTRSNVSFEWIPDPEGVLTRSYAVEGIPTVFIINGGGKVLMVSDGAPGDASRIAKLLRMYG